ETELEIYSEQTRHVFDGASPKGYQLELEVEHGITDHWDVALYQVFDQSDTEAFHFDALQLESRYRFAERGEWPVDVEVYGEFVKHWGASEYEGEGKVILGRDIGPVTLAA